MATTQFGATAVMPSGSATTTWFLLGPMLGLVNHSWGQTIT
jgi:hypothetical protein